MKDSQFNWSIGVDDHRKYIYQPYEEILFCEGKDKAIEAIRLDVDNVFSMVMHEYKGNEIGELTGSNILMLLQSGLVRPLQMYFMIMSEKLEPFVCINGDDVHLGLKDMETQEEKRI